MSIQVFNNDASVAAQAAGEKRVEETKSAPVAQEAAEQKTSEASEPSETEAEESGEEEDESSDADGDELEAKDGESTKEDDKPKKKSGSQRRKERAERAEAEVARLQRLVEQMALKGAGDSKPETTEATKPKSAAPQDGEPNPDNFETHRDYVKALAKYEAAQMLKDRDAQAEEAKRKSEHEQMMKSHFDRVKSFASKVSDWEDVIESAADVKMSATVEQILVTSENGPELLYELAKNKAEFERICSLGPIAAARELGKLETKLSSASDESKKLTETKKQTTQAPAPITPVGSKGGKVEKSIYDVASNGSQKEYEAIRQKQMAARQSSW
jgi:hypothetical protein